MARLVFPSTLVRFHNGRRTRRARSLVPYLSGTISGLIYGGRHTMMWFRKPVIAGTALSFALTAFGAGRDIGALDGNGDNTVPHTVPASGLATTTTSISVSTVYVANMLTGEEARVPPLD